MPRRRSTKVRSKNGNPRPVNRSEGKMKKWEKISDIPLDEVDQFHNSRDKILLDGDNLIDDDNGDEDEVFALKGLEDESEDDSEEDEDEDQDEDVNMDDVDNDEAMEEVPTPKKKPKSHKKSKPAHSDSSSEQESEEETWGRSKSAYYSSNAAQLDSDDEEANELEEQEARRLQAKSREDLEDADFGLEDSLEIEILDRTHEPLEPAPVATAPLPQDASSIIRHLEKTSPETLALSRDWEDTAHFLMETQDEVAKAQADGLSGLPIQLMHLRYQTLLSYATTLAFYIYLRSSEKYVQRPELLRSHPVMGRLLTLKQALATIEEFETGLKLADSDEDSEDDELDDLLLDDDDALERLGLDKDELRLLLMDAEHAAPHQPPQKKRKTSAKASKPGITADASTKQPIFDLVEPEFTASSKSSSTHIDLDVEMADAYGEASSLQHADAADKKAHKKSLRFHTSKIESASAKRQGARSQAVGGDDDIPYRERRREKEARLAKEAAAKVRGQGGADLDDTTPEAKVGTQKDDHDGSSDENGVDGYYDLVKKKAKAKKEQKKAEYEAAQAAARSDGDEQDDMSGPRSLTRAILANKGLTPHRAKAVRNPRVKKRQKFEKAKKKLSSIKPVFKGGLADTGGRYEGEKSGISKAVKSVRLG